MSLNKSLKNKLVELLPVFALIFSAVFFLILGTKFKIPQNDDWVYRLNVVNFLNWKLKLHPYIGPTFILQGLIGALWVSVFGIQNLSILTSLITILNLGLFLLILNRFLRANYIISTFALLIYAFNPWNVYLSIGFMTGQYFMLFFLLSLITLFKYQRKRKLILLFGLIIISFLGLLIRQVSLVIPLGFLLFYGAKNIGLVLKSPEKKLFILREVWIGILWFISMFWFLEFIFPKTPRMIEVPLQFHHLWDLTYTFSLVYGIFLLLVAFLLPFFLAFIFMFIRGRLLRGKTGSLLILAFLGTASFFILSSFSKPEVISWGEFPYFENTFERTGLYPRGVAGTKYQFSYNYDLYHFWDLGAKVIAAFSLVVLLFRGKKILKPEFFLILVYIGVLVVTETFYDRYLLPLIPLMLIFLIRFYDSTKPGPSWFYALFSGFIIFLTFFSYQLAFDFICVNNYIWHKSEDLVESGVPPDKIHGTNAWKLTYRNSDKNYLYYFTYDSPDVNPDLKKFYNLVESKRIDFPLNLFIEPKVYLYELK